MERVNRLLKQPLYRQEYKKLQEAEKDRRFCGHSMEHFLDTARIACLLAVENGQTIDKEMIYAAALLHDLGRARQYSDQIPHHEASAVLAEQLLGQCGFSDEETKMIAEAIRQHRQSTGKSSSDFAELLNRADHLSRMCFLCPAEAECNWPMEKKNHEISL